MIARPGKPLNHRENVEAVVARVGFRGWKFLVGNLGDGFYIQPQFFAPDTDTAILATQTGRKWYVSPHATEEEVVKTCWLAAEIACRHEAMEGFKLDGVSIFHPHTSTDALVEMQRTEPLVHRPDKETNPKLEAAIAMAHNWEGPVPSGQPEQPEPSLCLQVTIDRLGLPAAESWRLRDCVVRLVSAGFLKVADVEKKRYRRYTASSVEFAIENRAKWWGEIEKILNGRPARGNTPF